MNYKDRDVDIVLVRRLFVCNLGFVYMKNFLVKIKCMFIFVIRFICVIFIGNNIDFGIFVVMFRNCDKVGVNSKFLINL